MNAEKQAREDAKEFARAQMFYGEGAGIRRRLISAQVESRTADNQKYARAFRQELARQDMSEHAKKASRERLIKDKSHSINKNIRGLATGNYQSVSSSVIVIGALGYVLHQTGLDKVVYEKAKKKIEDFKARRKVKKSGVYNITNLR